MKYTAHTPKEAGQLIAGDYAFEVTNAEETVSKVGNDMIELTLQVEGRKVWDRLVFTPKAAFRIDQFLAAIGREIVDGEEVEIEADDLIGKTGRCRIEPVKDENGKLKNEVKHWIWAKKEAPAKEQEGEDELF
jgi:hypothetical protein